MTPPNGSIRTLPSSLGASSIVFISLVLTSLGMSAVFAGFAWLAPVILITFLIAATGLVFRIVRILRASGLVVLAQSALALYTALALTVSESFIGGVIPTGKSFIHILSTLNSGLDDIYSTSPPTPATPGLVAMMVVGFGLFTILIDGLVSELRTPKVAGIVLLVAWIVPVFVAARHVEWWHFTAIAVAFLLLMTAPYVTTSPVRIPFMAVGAGLVALVIGIALPLVLPQVDIRPSPGGNNNNDLHVVNPFVNLRENLDRPNSDIALKYTTNDPLSPPLRLTAVSKFNGTTWEQRPFTLDPFAVAVEGLPNPPGLSLEVQTETFHQEINIVELNQSQLPVSYAAQKLSGTSRRWVYNPDTFTILGNGEITSGLTYSVDYVSPRPTREQLLAAEDVSRTKFSEYLEVPDSLPPVVENTAEEVTAGAKGPWEKAVALQKYFRSDKFEYSLSAPEEASGSVLADFLEDKAGYCVQFSAAMATMSRQLGIPARIGVGFAPNEGKTGTTHTVRFNQAHAWPELYFDDIGWLRFEPTPGGPAGNPPPWSTKKVEAGSEPSSSPNASTTPTPQPAPENGHTGAPSSQGADNTPVENTAASSTTILWWVLSVIALAMLLLLPAAVRLFQTRRRLRLPRQHELVWREVMALAKDYGKPLKSTQTLRTQGEIVQGILPRSAASDTHEALENLVRAVEEKRYAYTATSPAPAVPADTEGARDAGNAGDTSAVTSTTTISREAEGASRIDDAQLIKAIRQGYSQESSWVMRVLARFAPRSVFDTKD